MGLDVSFYASATLVHGDLHPRALSEPKPGPSEECWDTFTVAYVNPDFPEQADGITPQSCWRTGKRSEHIGQPYSSYGRFRSWLSMAAHGVEPEVIWEDHKAWWDKPFVPLIHFSDCEGIIGPVTSFRLAQEFVEERDAVVARAQALPKPFDATEEAWAGNIERFVSQYDRWAAAFGLVGPTGFVRFA